MNYVWWAVRGARVQQVIENVIEPAGFVRDPRWMTTTDLEECDAACFAVGEWTFAWRRDAQTGFDEYAARGEALRLIWDEENQWATLTAYLDGQQQWTVSGSAEDATFRVTGNPPVPEDADALVESTETPEEVPLEMARRLTGFVVDDPGPSIRIVRFNTGPQAFVEEGEPPPSITVRVREQSGALSLADIDIDGDSGSFIGFSVMARDEDRILVETRHHHLFSIDMTAFPPAFVALGTATSDAAALTPWNSTLVASVDDNARTVLREYRGGRSTYISLPFDAIALHGMRRVPTGVVVFPAHWASGEVVPHLLTTHPDGHPQFTPLALPAPIKGDRPMAIGFGDESFLIRWHDTAYRWHRGALAPIAPLPVPESVALATTARDGSVLLISGDHTLVRLHSDGSRERVAGVDPTLVLAPGPEDAIICDDGEGDSFKILWSTTGEVTVVPYEMLGLEEDPEVVYYDRKHALLCVLATGLHALSWRAIEALPRYHTL